MPGRIIRAEPRQRPLRHAAATTLTSINQAASKISAMIVVDAGQNPQDLLADHAVFHADTSDPPGILTSTTLSSVISAA